MRENNDGHVCPKCGETIYREECACPEPLEGQELLGELFQRVLAFCYTTARTRNLVGFLQQSSPLVGVKRLDVSFEEIQ
jgi:hypothetical protein